MKKNIQSNLSGGVVANHAGNVEDGLVPSKALSTVKLATDGSGVPTAQNLLPCAESASGDAGRRPIRVECVHSSARGCDFPVPVLAEQLVGVDPPQQARESITGNETHIVKNGDSRGGEKPSRKKEARLAERKSLTKRDRPRGGVILSGIRERGWQLISDFEMEVAYSYFWKVKRNRTPPMAGTGGVMGGDPFDDEFGSMLGNYRKPNLGNAS